MANIVSTTKDSLKKIFDKVNRVYYFADNKDAQGAVKSLDALTGGIELPVLEDGVGFNTGDPEKNEVKLTDGTIWTSKVSQGDSDISFQVSSVHTTINDLLMEKKTVTMIHLREMSLTIATNRLSLSHTSKVLKGSRTHIWFVKPL